MTLVAINNLVTVDANLKDIFFINSRVFIPAVCDAK